MKSEAIAADLTKMGARYSALAIKLDGHIVKFQNELPEFARKWVIRAVESCIESHPDLVGKLGTAKLKILKAKVAELIDSLPEISMLETSDRNAWPHHRLSEKTDYRDRSEESYFAKSFRSVISRLGAVLDEFGLLSEPKGHTPLWQRVSPGMYRYAISTGFETVANTTDLAEYSKDLRELQSLSKAIVENEEALKKAKAKELWDSA